MSCKNFVTFVYFAVYKSLKVFTYRLPKIIYSVGSSFGKYDLLQLSGCAQLLHLALVGVEVLGVSIERRKSKHNSRSILMYFIVLNNILHSSKQLYIVLFRGFFIPKII